MPDQDPIKYFESEVKRLNYYNSQFLVDKDFNDEQLYHKQMRRLHNRALHTWGIVEGLEVGRAAEAGKVKVAAGIAIDRLGREIVLPEESDAVGTDAAGAGGKFYATIRYNDVFDPADKDVQATQTTSQYYTRTTERPGVIASADPPPPDSADVLLAVVTLDDGGAVAEVDRSVRRYAGGRFGSSDDGSEFSLYADTAGAWHFFDGAQGADRLTVDAKGYVGIGAPKPGFPLSLSDALGDKISLRGQSGNSYGFGVQDSLLQIHTDAVTADIAFGHGSSAALTETVRIKGNGKVGVGTNDPQATLDVRGDLKVGGSIASDGNVAIGAADIGVARLGVGGVTGYNQGLRLTGNSPNGVGLAMENTESGGHRYALLSGGSSNGPGNLKGAFGLYDDTVSAYRLVVNADGNVGIGTNEPGASRLRVASGNDFAHFRFAAGGAGELEFAAWQSGWNVNARAGGKHLYLNRDSSDTSDVLIGRAGKEVVVKGGTGNVGIGATAPGFPLSFPNTLGDKISLWGQSGNHYGFGIQSGLLQIHTDGVGSDVVFGYGSSESFTETMRVKGGGALDVNGRILRKGRDFSVSGAANHDQVIPVPWGTVDDWSIFVAPRTMGFQESGHESDNALLVIECYATRNNNTSWKVTARFRHRWSNDMEGVWTTEKSSPAGVTYLSVNYLLVPR